MKCVQILYVKLGQWYKIYIVMGNFKKNKSRHILVENFDQLTFWFNILDLFACFLFRHVFGSFQKDVYNIGVE